MKTKKSDVGAVSPVKKEELNTPSIPEPLAVHQPDFKAETGLNLDGDSKINLLHRPSSVPHTPAGHRSTLCPLGPRRVSQAGQEITRRLIEPGGYLDSQTGDTQALEALGLLAPQSNEPSSPLATRNSAPFPLLPLALLPLGHPTAPLEGVLRRGSSPGDLEYTSGEEMEGAAEQQDDGRPGLTHTPSSQRAFFPENLGRLVRNGQVTQEWALAHQLPNMPSFELTTPAPTVHNNQPNEDNATPRPNRHAPVINTPPRTTHFLHPASEPHRQPADRIRSHNERRAVGVVRDMAQDATEAAMAALSRTTRERNETLQELEELRQENKRLRRELDEADKQRRK